MINNLEKYKKDLSTLIQLGELLHNSFQKECHPNEFEEAYKKVLKGDYDKYIKKLPNFSQKYQEWYSESLTLIKQLMPDRVPDFIKLYEKPRTNRKEITHENYTIEDSLFGLRVTRGWEKELVVGPSAGIPRFTQQLYILKSLEKRFESSLFDIQQLVQADLFDSEIDASKELCKNGFFRAAGALTGVVLEKHLSQVCSNHGIQVLKKNPGIADYNDLLKNNSVYETATWRKIQLLGDLRNLCDHNKKKEPTHEDIDELITGTDKIIKTIF